MRSNGWLALPTTLRKEKVKEKEKCSEGEPLSRHPWIGGEVFGGSDAYLKMPVALALDETRLQTTSFSPLSPGVYSGRGGGE